MKNVKKKIYFGYKTGSKMLNEREKSFAKNLLQMLDVDVLLPLAQTVTSRQISAFNKNEAIEAIITYTETARELLKRKKMARDVLFQYLAVNHVIVPVNSEKSALVEKIVEMWSQPKENATGQVAAPNNIQPIAPPRNTLPQNEPPHQVQQTSNQAGDEDQAFAEQFAQWFFSLLNKCSANSTSAEFAVSFYPDCKLDLFSITQGEGSRREQFDSGDLAAKRLLAFIREEQLQFNPNISKQGVRAQITPHGLRKVMVCGTVHHTANVVGIFEQCFGLARDLNMENNWRIKMLQLKLRAVACNGVPSLEDTEKVLAITSS